MGKRATLARQRCFAEVAVRPAEAGSVAAEFPSLVFGFAAQTEQVPGMTHELFGDSPLSGVRWEYVENALQFGRTADEAKVQPSLALQILHALPEMVPVPGSVHEPHQSSSDCADDRDNPEHAIHRSPFLPGRLPHTADTGAHPAYTRAGLSVPKLRVRRLSRPRVVCLLETGASYRRLPCYLVA
jgi:hypothetical protein